MNKGYLLGIFFLILLVSSAYADVNIVVFYGQGCPHCSKELSFLSSLEQKYSNLNIEKYEVYANASNRELLLKTSKEYKTTITGVPTLFIDDKVITGFSNNIGQNIEQEIIRCSKTDCIHPLKKENNGIIEISTESSPLKDPKIENIQKRLTIPTVLSAALIDAINPCAFAVLIILLTTILASSNKKRALFAGIAFTISIYISYFLMGIGLFTAIQSTGISHIFYSIVAVLAILIGLFNLKDYFWYGKLFIMEVPMSWRPKLKNLIKSITSIPGAFLIGFVVSLFLLPCTSGPYIVILGLLAQITTRNYALILLLIYNFIFILPMLLITIAVYFGLTTTEKAEKLRQEKLKLLHLIAGIIMILIGIAMFIAISLGYI